jgi:hypothetical protein
VPSDPFGLHAKLAAEDASGPSIDLLSGAAGRELAGQTNWPPALNALMVACRVRLGKDLHIATFRLPRSICLRADGED